MKRELARGLFRVAIEAVWKQNVDDIELMMHYIEQY